MTVPLDEQKKEISFNPCFNGRCKRTVRNLFRYRMYLIRFNPCFNGRCKRTVILDLYYKYRQCVSILVLMEDVKEPLLALKYHFPCQCVSILVLMEDVKELYIGNGFYCQ